MAYQRVGDVAGGSDSEGKLNKIKLPYLKGKSFLDLGCNMGFFCRAARERGASRVVGVDAKPQNIEEARRLDPEGTYLAKDWYQALRELDGAFDVIVHLSAFHYVTDQFEFLRLVEQRLAPGGVFILECGVVDSEVPRYTYVRRGLGATTKHITSALLRQLLRRFAARKTGRSVDQRGDPIPRFIYHCYRRQPTVIMLGGEPQSGKSILGSFLASHDDTATIGTDELVRSLQHAPDASVASLLQDYFANSRGLEGVGQAVIKAGRVRELTASIADLVPNCYSLVVMEGQLFSDGRIRQSLANQLMARGFRSWAAERNMLREIDPEHVEGLDLLRPHGSIEFRSRAVSERLVRRKPVDNEVMLAVRRGPVVTSACWSFPPDGKQRFECWLRVDAKSRPIEFAFDVFDSARVAADTDVFDVAGPAEKRAIVVVEGRDRFEKLSFELPLTSGRTLLRVAVRMANPEDTADHARAFIATPRLVAVDALPAQIIA